MCPNSYKSVDQGAENRVPSGVSVRFPLAAIGIIYAREGRDKVFPGNPKLRLISTLELHHENVRHANPGDKQDDSIANYLLGVPISHHTNLEIADLLRSRTHSKKTASLTAEVKEHLW